jgi:hypothetical protein
MNTLNLLKYPKLSLLFHQHGSGEGSSTRITKIEQGKLLRCVFFPANSVHGSNPD